MGPLRLALGVTGLAALGCALSESKYDAAPASQEVASFREIAAPGYAEAEPAAAPSPPADRASAARPMMDLVNRKPQGKRGNMAPDDSDGHDAEVGGAAAEPAVRDWFPDTFLWAPVVETDDDGLASLEIRVPDTLTDWRVLGLAHDRSGQQAGAITTFASRLPVYVEPALPAWLHTGDQLELPVRAGNGTDGPLRASFAVSTSGALQGGGSADAQLGPGGVGARTFRVAAVRSGAGTVRASVAGGGERDAVERTLRVVPTGTPVESAAAGTVQQEVELALPRPDGGGADEELVVTVLAGPLSVLGGELERVATGRTALPGVGLALAAEAEALAARTGSELDAALLRKVRLVAFQSVVRGLATSDPATAADLLHAAGDDSGVGGFEAARRGLADKLVGAQHPDGTWSWKAQSTLQQVLVQTAHAATALPEDRTTARLRAAGACERHAPAVEDPFTAAVLLGSGLAGEGLAETLLERVREGLARDEHGVASVEVPRGVVSAWGRPPSEVEALAWTVLALPEGDADRGALAAELAGRWTPGIGFGAGRADIVAVRALLAAVPGASAPTEAQLWIDGAMASAGALDPTDPGAPVVLRGAVTAAGEARLVLEPPVDGVVWTAVRRSWVPLDPSSAGLAGVEVEVRAEELQAGVEGTLSLAVSAPAGVRLTIEQGLPAGATVDAERATGGVATVLPDRVRIEVAAAGGGVHEIGLPVTPAFGGRFTTAPLRITVDGGASGVWAPMAWTARP
jgi:hypothetical protein